MIALILAVAVMVWAVWRYWPNKVDTGIERVTSRTRTFYQSDSLYMGAVQNHYE